LRGPVIVSDSAIRANGRAGGTLRDDRRFDTHSALLLTGEFAARHLLHFHAAYRAIARPVADEIHHWAGPALAGDNPSFRVYVSVGEEGMLGQHGDGYDPDREPSCRRKPKLRTHGYFLMTSLRR
jgi:hypothetical protein